MKNILKIIGKNLFAGFIFVIGVALTGFFFVYASSLFNINDGDTLSVNTLNGIIDKVNELSSGIIPTGAIIPFNSTNCPNGWVKADGDNGTPDLRGEFIRGWDNGKGTDIGRVLASWQDDMFKEHNHNQSVDAHSGSDSEILPIAFNRGYPLNGIGEYNWVVTLNEGSRFIPYGILKIGNTGGIETRPRNIALLYCMKQ